MLVLESRVLVARGKSPLAVLCLRVIRCVAVFKRGEIERYHRTMKNVVKLQHYYFPWELEAALRDFVAYYNNERNHESLDNVTPADAYFGRLHEVLTERAKIKRRNG